MYDVEISSRGLSVRGKLEDMAFILLFVTVGTNSYELKHRRPFSARVRLSHHVAEHIICATLNDVDFVVFEDL